MVTFIILQLFSQPGDGNIHLFPVFGYGAPCDIIPLLLEHSGETFIAQGFSFILHLDNILEDLFYFPGGDLLPAFGGKRFGKEIF